MQRAQLGGMILVTSLAAYAFLGAGREAYAPRLLPDATAGALESGTEARAIFAGGCFWGIEAVFEHVKGVNNAVSGYAGGQDPNPNYGAVSSGRTGHAEVVEVTYDPNVVSYETLLKIFFSVAHDPTQLNRQGPDVGTQYRSAIFYVNEEQARVTRAYIAQLTSAQTFTRPIVTQVAPLDRFHAAEAYHQDYMKHHPDQPYIVHHDRPKVEALRQHFPTLFQER